MKKDDVDAICFRFKSHKRNVGIPLRIVGPISQGRIGITEEEATLLRIANVAVTSKRRMVGGIYGNSVFSSAKSAEVHQHIKIRTITSYITVYVCIIPLRETQISFRRHVLLEMFTF